MEHQNLLYYSDATELEEAQGTGGTVTTVRPGVAYEHAMRGVRYNKKKTTYSVTVNYKRINGTTIESSTTIETPYVMPGKTTKVKINAIDIEGYAPVLDSVKLLVSADTSYDFLYKMYTAYTVTVNYVDASGETIACATTITTDEVPETDEVRVTITPESIPGYNYTGETPIVIWVSGDTEYDIEYEESLVALCEFGDVVYYDGSELKTIAYTEWDNSLGEPLSFITIPTNVAPDGNPRMIWPIYDESTGNINGYAMAQFPITSQIQTESQIYEEMPTWNNDSGSPVYSVSDGDHYYCDLPVDSLSDFPCAGNGNYGYGSYGNEDALIPPMITPNGELNEHCMTALTNGNAMTDWNGLGNTLEISGVCSAASNCLNLNVTDIIPAGTFYLPALGELSYAMTRLGELNYIASVVFGASAGLTIGGATSTRYSSTKCFGMSNEGDIKAWVNLEEIQGEG